MQDSIPCLVAWESLKRDLGDDGSSAETLLGTVTNENWL